MVRSLLCALLAMGFLMGCGDGAVAPSQDDLAWGQDRVALDDDAGGEEDLMVWGDRAVRDREPPDQGGDIVLPPDQRADREAPSDSSPTDLAPDGAPLDIMAPEDIPSERVDQGLALADAPADVVLDIPEGDECGDGVRQGDEECDGFDLGGASCASLGLGVGPLACRISCHLDASGCHQPAVDAGEGDLSDLAPDAGEDAWADMQGDVGQEQHDRAFADGEPDIIIYEDLAGPDIPVEVTCDDGLDNDGDGLIDCEDGDCEARICDLGGVVCLEGSCGMVDCTGSIPSFCHVSAGDFTMGSPVEEPGYAPDETKHEVKLTVPFLLKATELLQTEWEALMGNQPAYFAFCGPDCGVDQVSWWDALGYCNALSEREGRESCYTMEGCTGEPGAVFRCDSVEFMGLECGGYRLPTEAEWEFAVRAGTVTAVYTGDITGEICQYDPNLDRIAWYCANTMHSSPVATKEANEWGLFDMVGNLMEWVWDWYVPYEGGPAMDPLGPEGGEERVLRGGNWFGYGMYCRSGARHSGTLRIHDWTIGFRPALSLPE